MTYKRNYFKSKFGRITIDKKINYQKVNHNMEIIGAVFKEHANILELKYDDNKGKDKNRLLSYIGYPETRNSKYCNGINLINHNKQSFAS